VVKKLLLPLLPLLVLLMVSPVRAGAPIEGWASEWQGPGAATHDCVWPWTDCAPRKVQSLQTGITIIVTPTMYCLCEVPGSAHPERLIDLPPSMVRALGLDPAQGLFPVAVTLLEEPALPNTATR
jgi:hypothetical protein